MTIQWHYESLPGMGVLSLSGHLGSEALPRFVGAVGWTLARGQGPLILDLTALRGWSQLGRDAVVAAAWRLAAQGRPLELAGLPQDRIPLDLRPGEPEIPVHADLATALAAHHLPDPDGAGPQHWRTAGWTSNPPSTND